MSDKTSHEANKTGLLSLTAQIVSAYARNNNVAAAELPALMASIYQNLSHLGSGKVETGERREPAVPVRRSITPEYIICLEDGKKLKMLKRHLKTSYGMTVEQYRERWNLPADYPMVAPNYAKQRSKLAKQIGLGTARRTTKKKAA